MITQLINKDGELYTPNSAIEDAPAKEWAGDNDTMLVHFYPAGDWDSIVWPNPNIKHLRSALYDARETGHIPGGSVVLLPDGTEFNIDEPYWKVGDHVTWRDPDDGVCSRTGVLSVVDAKNADHLYIEMEDGWGAEICESELERNEY